MSPTVDPEQFRGWMGRFATGVTVVTAREAESSYGLTVNAFLSVSLQPPTVLVSLLEDADTTPVVRRTRSFAVNLLSAHQRSLSERFARPGGPAEKFAGLPMRLSPAGLPLLPDTLGSLECRVREEHSVGDHRLFVAEVVGVERGVDDLPLLFFRSQYSEADGSSNLRLPPGKP